MPGRQRSQCEEALCPKALITRVISLSEKKKGYSLKDDRGLNLVKVNTLRILPRSLDLLMICDLRRKWVVKWHGREEGRSTFFTASTPSLSESSSSALDLRKVMNRSKTFIHLLSSRRTGNCKRIHVQIKSMICSWSSNYNESNEGNRSEEKEQRMNLLFIWKRRCAIVEAKQSQ